MIGILRLKRSTSSLSGLDLAMTMDKAGSAQRNSAAMRVVISMHAEDKESAGNTEPIQWPNGAALKKDVQITL